MQSNPKFFRCSWPGFDCLTDFNDNGWPNIVILVSGDGDFCPFLSHLQKIGIRAIAFARKGNVKKTLIDSADEFYFIEDLPKLIGSQNQSHLSKLNQKFQQQQSKTKKSKKNQNSQAGIAYDRAVFCLIEAIKTASSEGKPTRFSYLDNLMRNNPKFPHYQGAGSIQKLDGTKFSKFGKFIETAVKGGKVRLKPNCQIPELILRG